MPHVPETPNLPNCPACGEPITSLTESFDHAPTVAPCDHSIDPVETRDLKQWYRQNVVDAHA